MVNLMHRGMSPSTKQHCVALRIHQTPEHKAPPGLIDCRIRPAINHAVLVPLYHCCALCGLQSSPEDLDHYFILLGLRPRCADLSPPIGAFPLHHLSFLDCVDIRHLSRPTIISLLVSVVLIIINVAIAVF